MLYHRGYQDLDGLAETVSEAVADLRPYKSEFDSITVTGISGVVVGAPVALRLRKPLVVLRKREDKSHTIEPAVNHKKLGQRTLFLDDFVAQGGTRKKVEAFVTKAGARVVGEYMYRDGVIGMWGPDARRAHEADDVESTLEEEVPF